MAITNEKIYFPSFRKGWSVPPKCWTSHYMIRQQMTNRVRSACGKMERHIELNGNGLHALWNEGTYPRCKLCIRAC